MCCKFGHATLKLSCQQDPRIPPCGSQKHIGIAPDQIPRERRLPTRFPALACRHLAVSPPAWLRVWGSGFRVQGLGCGIEGFVNSLSSLPPCGVQGFGFRVDVVGCRLTVYGVGFND